MEGWRKLWKLLNNLISRFIWKHCLKSVRIGVILVRIFLAFSHIWTEYGDTLRISPYSVQMRENAGKMQTRITPNAQHFLGSEIVYLGSARTWKEKVSLDVLFKIRKRIDIHGWVLWWSNVSQKLSQIDCWSVILIMLNDIDLFVTLALSLEKSGLLLKYTELWRRTGTCTRLQISLNVHVKCMSLQELKTFSLKFFTFKSFWKYC